MHVKGLKSYGSPRNAWIYKVNLLVKCWREKPGIARLNPTEGLCASERFLGPFLDTVLILPNLSNFGKKLDCSQ